MANPTKILKLSAKDRSIIKILLDNPEGLREETIKKLTNIKERTLYNHLNYLKSKEILANLYPIWKLCQNQYSYTQLANLLDSSKTIQSHKFSFHLRLIRTPDWWQKRENRLIKLKDYNFKINKEVNFGNNPYEELIKDDFLIHIFKSAIYFINQKEYLNNDSYLALEEAIKDTLAVLSFLEEKFRFKFFINEAPQFSIKTNHYVKLNDEIAKKCKENNNLLQVYINKELRAWVDMSQPFGLETGNKDYGAEDMNRYAPFVADIIENNHLLPSKLTELSKSNTEQISQMIKVQTRELTKWEEYSRDIVEHKEAIKILGSGILDLRKEIKGLSRAIKSIKKENTKLKQGNQKTIFDF